MLTDPYSRDGCPCWLVVAAFAGGSVRRPRRAGPPSLTRGPRSWVSWSIRATPRCPDVAVVARGSGAPHDPPRHDRSAGPVRGQGPAGRRLRGGGRGRRASRYSGSRCSWPARWSSGKLCSPWTTLEETFTVVAGDQPAEAGRSWDGSAVRASRVWPGWTRKPSRPIGGQLRPPRMLTRPAPLFPEHLREAELRRHRAAVGRASAPMARWPTSRVVEASHPDFAAAAEDAVRGLDVGSAPAQLHARGAGSQCHRAVHTGSEPRLG